MANGLLTDLVAYWKMDEASGIRYDAHGSYDLADPDTIGDGTGIINSGVQYNNTIEALTNTSIDLQSDFSIQMWINLDVIDNDNNRVIDCYSGSVYPLLVQIIRDNHSTNPSKLLFWTHEGSTNDLLYSNTQLDTADTWYHVVLTWDETTKEKIIWINASSDADKTAAHGTPITSTNDFRFGAQPIHPTIDGVLDECAYWSRVLTSDDVSALYNSGDALSYDDFDSGGSVDNSKMLLNF